MVVICKCSCHVAQIGTNHNLFCLSGNAKLQKKARIFFLSGNQFCKKRNSMADKKTRTTEIAFIGEGEQHIATCKSLGIILDPNSLRVCGKLPLETLTNGIMIDIITRSHKLVFQMPAHLVTFNIIKNNFKLHEHDFDDKIWNRVHTVVSKLMKRFDNLVRVSDKESCLGVVFELLPP